jgi:hypothetical protein
MIYKKTLCTGLLVVAISFKFWLIAEMEITDDPDDPPNYIAQILGHGPSFFGPGTGCLGKLFRALGLPFRDGIEILYLLSCLLVVRSLFDWPMKSSLALGVFLFMYFNPVPEELFSHMESDQVWLVEVLMGLSLVVFFVNNQTGFRWTYLSLAAICFSFATITRTAIIPLMACFLVWSLIAGSLWALKNKRGGLSFRVPAGLAALVGVIGIFNYSICYYNSIYYGYFGISIVDCREYNHFYMTLQSVGDATGDKYYPVDSDRLDLVAQAGPVSNRFVEQMRTDQNFRRVSRDAYGKFDLALPWFSFVVFYNTVPNGDLRQGFAMFKAIENEISQAARENRLKVRTILPLPDCRIAKVLSAVPDAFQRVGAIITFVPNRYAWAVWRGEPQFDNVYFTKALTRRTVVRSPVREYMGRALCTFYRIIYGRTLPGLELAAGIYMACLVYHWRKIANFSPRFLAQQLFAVFFVGFFFWYVLFVASGLPASPRYMIFQNVMLPLLLVYYARMAYDLMFDSAEAVKM